ncbi:MAG TPA: transglutaminase family protein [Noviherbaspirillum sp.]|uniref:transglutaminase-like domain-containing protein n=1 Tax=Noviherbaspirillum sp. TaxID=1926288 RepID=UPI002D6A931F|nr:transglutaminase family protein [Noviherbaspirillum sp.]HYD96866.1 transglutaminase family protein [Noviherbaspirillum sp.]
MVIRLGCSLSYIAEERSQILLLVQPAPGFGQRILSEEVAAGSGGALHQFTDSHGNKVLRTNLLPGLNEFRHDAVLVLPTPNIDYGPRLDDSEGSQLPFNIVRYTLPSRYCEADKLVGFATKQFSTHKGLKTVQNICDWTHHHLEYRYGSGDPTLSACEALRRGYGVCRDFAHVMVALCRALDIPARYAAGHIPLIGASIPDSDIGIDFHAYVEVYVEGVWRVFDPRYNRPDVRHIKVAHGADAVDAAFATYFGRVKPVEFEVWSYAISDGVSVGDGQSAATN